MNKRTYSAAERRDMAAHGIAMPDGSFPIQDQADLLAAQRSIGRASDPAAARAHIRRRAKKLGLTKLLGESFQKDYYSEMGIYPYEIMVDPPDLPVPCTPADLTPTMQAAFPPEMQAEFCQRWNALTTPLPDGAGCPDDLAYRLAMNLLYSQSGWLQRSDGSYTRIQVEGDWSYEEDSGEMEKAGRTISAANLEKLTAARDALDELIQTAMPAEKNRPQSATILKTDPKEQRVWGWAYVCEDANGIVQDHSGDIIGSDNLREVVYKSAFKLAHKVEHKEKLDGRLVDTLFVTPDILDLIQKSGVQSGWLIGLQIEDKKIFKQVESGELSCFSIGGRGRSVNDC